MLPIKILFLTNNNISLNLFQWIKEKKEIEIILYNYNLTLDHALNFDPYLIISYNYKYIIKSDIINHFRNKIINLHISLLPWNRGADPNIWSFLENTPKGVTIHYIDEGIDSGDILFQKEIKFNNDYETLSSTYNKLHEEIQQLFKNNWNNIIEGKLLLKKQIVEGSIHYIRDFKNISFILGEKGWDTPINELIEKYKNIYGIENI